MSCYLRWLRNIRWHFISVKYMYIYMKKRVTIEGNQVNIYIRLNLISSLSDWRGHWTAKISCHIRSPYQNDDWISSKEWHGQWHLQPDERGRLYYIDGYLQTALSTLLHTPFSYNWIFCKIVYWHSLLKLIQLLEQFSLAKCNRPKFNKAKCARKMKKIVQNKE